MRMIAVAAMLGLGSIGCIPEEAAETHRGAAVEESANNPDCRDRTPWDTWCAQDVIYYCNDDGTRFGIDCTETGGSCPDGSVGGQCENDPECADLPRCDGDMLRWCDLTGVVQPIDCVANGGRCGDLGQGAQCIYPEGSGPSGDDACPDCFDLGSCPEDFCDQDDEYCDAGTRCVDADGLPSSCGDDRSCRVQDDEADPDVGDDECPECGDIGQCPADFCLQDDDICDDQLACWDEDGERQSCPEDGSCLGGDGECQPSCDLWANLAITCEDGAEVVQACSQGWTCVFVDAQGVPVVTADVPSNPACLTCEDAGELTCADESGCYFPEWECDGVDDCQDRSDESNC